MPQTINPNPVGLLSNEDSAAGPFLIPKKDWRRYRGHFPMHKISENSIINALGVISGHPNTARKTATGQIYLSSLARFTLDNRNKCSIIIGSDERTLGGHQSVL